jgi:hypothetical protein
MIVYPNPAKEYIIIKTEQEGDLSYEIFNSAGRMVLSGNALNGQQIDISGLSKGIYVLRAGDGYSIKDDVSFFTKIF